MKSLILLLAIAGLAIGSDPLAELAQQKDQTNFMKCSTNAWSPGLVEQELKSTAIKLTLIMLGALDSHPKTCGQVKVVQSAQDVVPPGAQADDKYHFDRNAFLHNPIEGVVRAGRLLSEAIANQAPAATIAKLRYEQALMAHKSRKLPAKELTVILLLAPIMNDPSPLLQDFASAKTFLSAVQLYCAPMYKESLGPVTPDEIIRQAIEDVNSAVALSERERFLASTGFMLYGSNLAQDVENYEKAIEWLNPLVEARDRLAEDEAGASILGEVVRVQSYYYIKLDRLNDGTSVIKSGIEAIKNSTTLNEQIKLIRLSRILSRHLLAFADHSSDPNASQAWRDAQEHLQNVEAYSGPQLAEVHASGIEISQMSVEFLQARNFERSAMIVANATRQFAAHPEITKDYRTVQHAVNMSTRLIELMEQANDPRAQEECKHLEAFLNQLEENGADKESIDDYRSFLRRRGS